jgi:hypothetical protein
LFSSNTLGEEGDKINSFSVQLTIQRRTELAAAYLGLFQPAPLVTLDYVNCTGGSCSLNLRSEARIRVNQLILRYDPPQNEYFDLSDRCFFDNSFDDLKFYAY